MAFTPIDKRPRVWQWSCHLFLRPPGFEHTTLRMRGERSYSVRHRRGLLIGNFFTSHGTEIQSVVYEKIIPWVLST